VPDFIEEILQTPRWNLWVLAIAQLQPGAGCLLPVRNRRDPRIGALCPLAPA
jgi:hypothetical protein